MAGVYIHIPFCKLRCHYCDFYKTTDIGLKDLFVNSLLLEIDRRKDYLDESDDVETVYFGGGTPSLLTLFDLRKIINKIRRSFKLGDNIEFTLEINPDDANKAFLEGLKKEGVNRLSIGIQSWDDKVLKMLNRRHNSKQAINAIEKAREAGFSNISIDLIYGIPGLDYSDWEKDIKKSFSLGVEHVSAYHLTIEPNTMFGKMLSLGQLNEIDEEESEKQFNFLTACAKNEGYIHYEISNFCKEGYLSLHNTNYWRQVKYLGLGPSAHSYNTYSREWNVADINEYIRRIEKGEVVSEKEMLDEKTRYNEYLMTSLRTMWGIDLNYLENSFNKEMHDYLLNMAARFIKYGMLEHRSTNTLVLTDQGKMISDNIISELIMA
ncbi:MAG: radical SAM family heme chaperone HemW [Bacteroidales bacterium]|nr:radical SAM family heme chaperone HemW [Bacteroidales bacterium]